MRFVRFFLLAFSAFGVLLGQNLLMTQHFVRHGESRYAYLPSGSDAFEPLLIPLSGPLKDKELRIKRPILEGIGVGYEFYDDSIYYSYNKRPTQGDKKQHCTVVRYDDSKKSWVPFAKVDAQGIVYLFPLNRDLLLGLSPMPGSIVSSGKSYPFGIYRIGESGEAKLIKTYDIGLEKPFFEGSKCNYPVFRETIIRLDRVANDDYFALFHRAGVFWVFSRSDGRLKRVIKLGNLGEKELQSGSMLEVITCVQPSRDGSWVLSTRDLDMATEGFKNMGPIPNAVTNPNRKQDVANHQKMLMKMYPDMFWYRLDPGTGRLEEMAKPVGAPDQVTSPEAEFAFQWRIDAHDRIEFMNEKNYKYFLGDRATLVPR